MPNPPLEAGRPIGGGDEFVPRCEIQPGFSGCDYSLVSGGVVSDGSFKASQQPKPQPPTVVNQGPVTLDVVVHEAIRISSNDARRQGFNAPRHARTRAQSGATWSNVRAISQAGEGAEASHALGGSLGTQLVAQDFGFRIPLASDITGVTVEIDRDVFGGTLDEETVSLVVCGVGTVSAHRHWRFLFTEPGSDGGDAAYVAEVQLRSEPGGSDQTGSGIPSADGDNQSPASEAFDNSTATYWGVDNSGYPHWLAYDFGSGNERAIAEYLLTSGTSGEIAINGGMPKGWSFQWADSPSGPWTTVDSRTSEPDWMPTQTRTYAAGAAITPVGLLLDEGYETSEGTYSCTLTPLTVTSGAHGLTASLDDASGWTPDEVNDLSFGVVYSARGSGVVRVDAVRVAVDYAGAFGESLPAKRANGLAGVAVSRTGRRVAVGANGKVLYSDDGETWLPANSGTNATLLDVVWAADRFIAVGRGVIIESQAGETWTNVPSPPETLYEVLYDRLAGRLMAVGESGVQAAPDAAGNWLTRYR